MHAPLHDEIDSFEHERRCALLAASAQPFDELFTFDPTSWISRRIASLSNGLWSHVGTVGLEGVLYEAVTSGVRAVELTKYLRQPYRLALYRPNGAIGDPHAADAWLQSQVGKRYAFGKATWAGLASVLNLPGRQPLPNDLLRRYAHVEVARV